jgi:hypothetical protein
LSVRIVAAQDENAFPHEHLTQIPFPEFALGPACDFYGLAPDFDRCVDCNQIKQPKNIFIAHPNTSVACRLPDETFLICAMDVDVALFGVGIILFQTIEPKNSGGNEIIAANQGSCDRDAAFEDGSARRIASDLFVNAK